MRAEVIEAREAKIKKKMDAMGDVLKKSDAEERAFEARILKDQLKRDEIMAQKEKEKAEAKRVRDQNLIKELEQQVLVKEAHDKKVIKDNEKFVKMVIDQDNLDNKNDKLAQKKALDKRLEVKRF